MLFQQIQKNKRKTWILYFITFFVIELLTGILVLIYDYATKNNFKLNQQQLTLLIYQVLIISTIWWLYIGGSTLYHFNFGIDSVMNANNAQEIHEKDHPKLWHIVEDMSMVANIPMPRVFIIPTKVQNACATGNNPQKAGLAVTQGLLDTLNREELEAVIGHEISHIRNYDIRVTMMMTCIIAGLTIINNIAYFFWIFGDNDWDDKDDDEDSSSLIGFVVYVISYLGIIASSLINLAMSRNREYLADASSVELTRNPQGMINALLKISGKSKIDVKPQYANMYFLSTKTTSLLDDHPSIEDRIKAIKKL